MGSADSRSASFTSFGILTALLFVNWLFAIARFQPNVIVMDQWDFFFHLFHGGGWWDRFVHQHGPVREGLGLVISGWVLEATDWDVRYDSVWGATSLLLATVFALRLKWKTTGALGLRDAWIPLLFLSLAQYETVLAVPQAAHSVVPLALTMLAANLWLSTRALVRYLGAAALAAILTFTGFGLFASAVVGALLAIHAVRRARARDYPGMALAAVGFGVVVTSWVRFSQGYLFQPAVDGFRFPWTPWTEYVRFVLVMLTLPLSGMGAGSRAYVSGTMLALVVAVATIRIAWTWVARRPSLNDDVLVLLMGSALLFSAATAVGRVPLGVAAATAPRYLSLMLPLWLAVYLTAAQSRRAAAGFAAAACVWLLALWPYASMVDRPLTEWPGTLGVTDAQVEAMETHGLNKAEWARVYLETGRWDSAQASVRVPIYPNPPATRLDEKLGLLRRRRLSFFAGQPERGDYLPWLAGETRVTRRCSDSSLPGCH